MSSKKENNIILVSVIIPVYNREACILSSIRSVMVALRNVKNEIIVIDDGSNDKTVKIVEEYAKKNSTVKLLKLEHIGKPAAVRNAGISLASGEFIAFQDSDDEWTVFDINERLKVFGDSSIVLSYANAEYGDGGLGIKKRFVPKGTELGRDPFNKLISRFHSPIPTPTVIVRRKLFEEIGLFNESLKVSEDVEFWSRVSMVGNFSFYNKVCAIINRDGSNISSLTSEDGNRALLDHEESQLKMFDSLLKQKNASEKQKAVLRYRIYEFKNEMDEVREELGIKRKYVDLTTVKKPTELVELEQEYRKTISGKADSLLKLFSFGNSNLYKNSKKLIRLLIRPFRRYI